MKRKSKLRRNGYSAAIFLLMASLVSPSIAWAAPTPDQMSEARRRYDRALELSDEGNYDEALLELQRAYTLAPTYRLLYNLGVVSVAVHDYVKAIDYFNRYLIEGGSDIEPARVMEVQTQIDRLKNRIAKIRVDVSVPDADIAVDNILVGKSPLNTLLTINSGRHVVTASLQGYFPATTVVEVVGNETKVVSLNLIRSVVQEKASRPIPWLGWGITAALGVGTAVTGVFALNSESSYDAAVNRLGVSGSEVNSDYRKMRTWSVTSDALLVATVIAAGVSFYFTIKSPKTSREHTNTSAIVTPSGVAF
jgi:hypothetical protein